MRPRAALAFGALALAGVAGPSEVAAAEPLLAHLVAELPAAPARDPVAHRLEVVLGVVAPAPRVGRADVVAREAYRLDAEYVYPASSVKLCLAVAALERVAAYTRLAGLGEFTSTRSVTYLDPQRGPTISTVAADVRGALVVSDNAAANRLYDFVGSDELHARMHALGLPSFAFRHRLAAAPGDDVAVTPSFDLDVGARGFVHVPGHVRRRPVPPSHVPGLVVGDARLEAGRSVEGGLDFTTKNRVSLLDLQRLLVRVVRPDVALAESADLVPADRAWLLESLELLPSDVGAPAPLGVAATDAAHKPLLPGLLRVLPKGALRYLSKGGRAYGFSVENAYVEDRRTGRAFFLAAALYTNRSGIVGDDDYEYRTVADPFFADLGEAVARAIFLPATAPAPAATSAP